MGRFAALLLTAIFGTLAGGAFAWTLSLSNAQPLQIAEQNSSSSLNSDDLIRACDELAAHPNDPSRMTSGIPDQQVAVGEAIEACKAAVDSLTEESSDYARMSFQYGRALWLAQNYDEAFLPLITATDLGYAAAMKYIGDAFLEGKGLPDGAGLEQDTYAALEWYKRSADAGFSLAEQAVQEVESLLKTNVFDSTIFKSPEYASRLYKADFDEISNPVLFIQYAQGMFKMLDSDQAMDHAPECKPLLSMLGNLKLKIGGITSYIDMLTDPNSSGEKILENFLTAAIGGTFLNDDGQRDAVTMINHLGCDSTVARQMVAGLEKVEPMIMQQVENMLGNVQ